MFAQHLNVYPREKIVNAYFASPKQVTATKEDGTSEEVTVYEPLSELSIGQKTYLVADCANLADKTIQLKIHEKADGNEQLKIQATEEDHFAVCKPKAENETAYTELPKDGWIEGTVDAKTNQAVIALQMRPKTDKMASDSEALVKSLEGWKEGLYLREDETAESQTNQRPGFTALTYNANAKRKSFPQKTTLITSEATVGQDITFETTFKTEADPADKNNVRWCMYIIDVHSSFPKVKKIGKDANHKDTADDTVQNAYTLITDRPEIADTDTDFTIRS